ncbi:MAG: hypothetical protein GYB50_25780 [Rhodobacteraceae bacterium]|nr:hypothetical protein [Paracoccaceae bacterium]
MQKSTDNRLRSIQHLAVLDGWFQPETDNTARYKLHLNASFRAERLGGTEESNIHFRIELRQCEIVVILPENGNGFAVDRSTVARSVPNSSLRITDKTHTSTGVEGAVDVGLDGKKPKLGFLGRISGKRQASTDTEYVRDAPLLETQHSMSVDEHRSWIVTSPINVLRGSLWDPELEPRFTMIDQRSPDTVEAERARNLSPTAIVQVRCKREDVHIDDVKFKDLEEDGIRQNRQNQAVRQRAAEAFLKAEIQRQRLCVGDIHDKFSDMTLAEYVIPLFE